MAEYRLFSEGTVPDFTTFEFFEHHDWIPPAVQDGHGERQTMVAELVDSLDRSISSVTDLGAGDGSLIELLLTTKRCAGALAWGYDAGIGNRKRAAELGLDVRPANIVDDLELLDFGTLVVCTEVVEHLLDPHDWLRRLAAVIHGSVAVFSSPSTETPERHYEHHAWAWDLDGYAKVISRAGFTVIDQVECAAGFQAVAVEVR